MFLSSLVTFTLAALVAQTTAQSGVLTPPVPDLCVDPPGYQKCDGDTHSQYTTCLTTCGVNPNNTCIAGCDRLSDGATLACWWTHCWNQLQGCYVQDQVLVYLTSPLMKGISPLPSFPFYPPQDGAGGACQCSLGKMLELWQLANATADPCPSGSDCSCCFHSALVSAYYDLCPTGNPFLAGFQFVQQNASSAVTASPNKCSILKSSSNPAQACASFGSTPFGAKEYLDLNALPSPFPAGSMSNNPGSVTALATPSGSTTVLNLPDFTTTITYMPFTSVSLNQGPSGGTPTLSPETAFKEAVSWTFGPSGGAAAQPTGGSGSGASTTGGSNPSNTGAAPAATSSKSAASGKNGVGSSAWWLLAFGAAVVL